MVPLTISLALLQLLIKTCAQGNLVWAILQLRIPSQVTLGCVKLTVTKEENSFLHPASSSSHTGALLCHLTDLANSFSCLCT